MNFGVSGFGANEPPREEIVAKLNGLLGQSSFKSNDPKDPTLWANGEKILDNPSRKLAQVPDPFNISNKPEALFGLRKINVEKFFIDHFDLEPDEKLLFLEEVFDFLLDEQKENNRIRQDVSPLHKEKFSGSFTADDKQILKDEDGIPVNNENYKASDHNFNEDVYLRLLSNAIENNKDFLEKTFIHGPQNLEVIPLINVKDKQISSNLFDIVYVPSTKDYAVYSNLSNQDFNNVVRENFTDTGKEFLLSLNGYN